MGLFGKDSSDDPLSDAALLKAVRQRILGELGERHATPSIINNAYGGSSHAGAPDTAGVMGILGGGAGGAGGEDPWDYSVDIRRDDNIDPVTGKKTGWNKTVRRHRTPKDSEHEKKK